MSHSCFISLHINPAHKYFYAATKYFYIFHIQFVLWLYCDVCEQSCSGGNLSKKFGSVSISVGWIWLGPWMLLMLLSAAVGCCCPLVNCHCRHSLGPLDPAWQTVMIIISLWTVLASLCLLSPGSEIDVQMLLLWRFLGSLHNAHWVLCCHLSYKYFAKFQLFFSPPTYARMKYSTREGRLPRLVVSEGRSQPMMSSIRCEARISRTDSEEYKLKLLW